MLPTNSSSPLIPSSIRLRSPPATIHWHRANETTGVLRETSLPRGAALLRLPLRDTRARCAGARPDLAEPAGQADRSDRAGRGDRRDGAVVGRRGVARAWAADRGR